MNNSTMVKSESKIVTQDNHDIQLNNGMGNNMIGQSVNHASVGVNVNSNPINDIGKTESNLKINTLVMNQSPNS